MIYLLFISLFYNKCEMPQIKKNYIKKNIRNKNLTKLW